MGLFPSNFKNNPITLDASKVNIPVGYKKGPMFDFKSGDLVRDGQNKVVSATGIEAWQQWCENCLMTQRGKFRAYSTDFGIDIERIFKSETREEAEMLLRKEITEALLADDYKRTVTVDSINISWINADSIQADISLIGVDGATIDIQPKINR